MGSPSQSNEIPAGAMRPEQSWGEYNRIAFAIQQALSKMQTATLVRVDAVTNVGDVSPVGFVDVTPLVNQLDAAGNPTPHATIYGLPYVRLQGGTNAIIIDPQVGDIGLCVFASRDLSKVKSTRGAANPGSLRQYSFSDGMYLGGMLNGTPTQYVRFSPAGIELSSPTKVTLTAPTVEIDAADACTINTAIFTVNGTSQLNGPTTVAGSLSQTGGGTATMSGTLVVTGDVTANGVSVHNHVHSDPQGGTTSPPL